MPEFRKVPDNLRDREPVKRGRPPRSELSLTLLQGSTVFVVGPRKTWGHIYKLAQNHNKQARTKVTVINEEAGTLVWFEDLSKESSTS